MGRRKIEMLNGVAVTAMTAQAVEAGEPNIRVTVSQWRTDDTVCEFFIPTATFLKGVDVFAAAVEARMKSEFYYELGRYAKVGY